MPLIILSITASIHSLVSAFPSTFASLLWRKAQSLCFECTIINLAITSETSELTGITFIFLPISVLKHIISVSLYHINPFVVLGEGVEPSIPKAPASKTGVYASSTTLACRCLVCYYAKGIPLAGHREMGVYSPG